MEVSTLSFNLLSLYIYVSMYTALAVRYVYVYGLLYS
jgi:hypothetical protein